MAKVTVSRPDRLGWRRVTIDGHPAGKARSHGELKAILRHANLPTELQIEWQGGGKHHWPDCSGARRVASALMAATLGATAYLLIKIGAKDMLGALTYAGRITGITLLVVALLEIVAAGAAVDYWHMRKVPFSGMAVLIGASISIALSSVLIFVQVWGWSYTDYLKYWILLLLFSLATLGIMIRERAWRAIKNPKRIVVGTVASALLAITNVTYTQIYVPYATSPVVQSLASFGKPTVDEKKTQMYLPVHLSVRNAGQIPVYVLGSIYWVHGGRADSPLNILIQDAEFIRPPGRPLNPGEEFSDDELIEIKRTDWNRYEAVDVRTELYVIRMDRVIIGGDYEFSGRSLAKLKKEHKENDPRGPADDYLRYQTGISNSNEILNVTRGPQRLTLWYTHRKDWPYLHVDVAPPGERIAFDPCKPDANKDAIKRYGLERVRGSIVEKPFTELLEAAKAEADVSSEPPKPEPTRSSPMKC
ncbi:hypothetical protein ABZ924_29120 [Streptomyces sp. NPDC046876]|uniref:hypothetical protein n=1 Tax=Streptomyces sp. NPDC046876 TaxID=3155616 RepID=UPI0033EF410B